jgi:hypothetical protein
MHETLQNKASVDSITWFSSILVLKYLMVYEQFCFKEGFNLLTGKIDRKVAKMGAPCKMFVMSLGFDDLVDVFGGNFPVP